MPSAACFGLPSLFKVPFDIELLFVFDRTGSQSEAMDGSQNGTIFENKPRPKVIM